VYQRGTNGVVLTQVPQLTRPAAVGPSKAVVAARRAAAAKVAAARAAAAREQQAAEQQAEASGYAALHSHSPVITLHAKPPPLSQQAAAQPAHQQPQQLAPQQQSQQCQQQQAVARPHAQTSRVSGAGRAARPAVLARRMCRCLPTLPLPHPAALVYNLPTSSTFVWHTPQACTPAAVLPPAAAARAA
jgi:hypothetical protein